MAAALAPAYALEGLVEAACAGLAHRIACFRHARTGLVLHLVPGGPVTLGRRGGAVREGPVREAVVGPLLVARAPVLQAEWDLLGGEDRREHRGPDLPITGVSWRAARDWLARAGDGLRLPREAEWEHACRAGSATAFPWGDAADPAWCWWLDSAGGRPHAPEEHAGRANAFGLIDASGNVAEWCDDDLDLAMEGSAWQEWDPGKVLRGGSWDRPSSHARSAWREGAPPDRADPDVGLRPVVPVSC
ncbi:MAG: SUMF1/EgtB/PvdO family nonheme iron enzyme [Planctomycetes bacterium]|nr:SUMF1/EgtB/PvdO family nonheme iron enzyme [Planctomycetota bacterium]